MMDNLERARKIVESLPKLNLSGSGALFVAEGHVVEAISKLLTEQQKPRLPVGVSVLITHKEFVLLGERINNTAAGLLSTPGGRVEEKEDILSCALRETFEETGLSLSKDVVKVVAWREHFRFGQHYIMFYVHAPWWQVLPLGQIENKEPEKCKGWIWCRTSALKQEQTTEPLEILNSLMEKGD